MFHKKIETFCIDEIRILLRGASSTRMCCFVLLNRPAVSDFEVFIFFDTLSCFASVGVRNLKSSRIGPARRMGNSTREITLNDEYLSHFLSDCKVLWMTSEQLDKIFINPPSVTAAEQYACCSGGKINFWSHLD